MRIDAISIFPEFFQVLDISLVGKARQQNLLDIHIHDLRQFTQDKHKSVDDTPFGGGAGMIMKPEPWGLALDSVLSPESIVVFPSPAGALFKQDTARQLANAKHLVFACGRYEGIDQRVVEYASTRAKVLELSLGDYVLNGGEVAAVAMIEAVVRLVPGVIGNSESLDEESHSAGLLEYPGYTKPAVWKGMSVPEVLLSGNHAEVEKWRKAQSLERTRQTRPDLLD
jgi:tRNA (guanine37-N1)-methyltransferase